MRRPSPNKYKAKQTIVDGIKFHSTGEAIRYSHLKLLEQAGEIKDLELQPKFVICERPRKRHYIADFRYVDVVSGESVVEDFKGFDTPLSKLKRQLVFDRYGIDVKLIGKNNIRGEK